MSFRYPKGGFITAFYDPLKVPDAPTIGTATAGDAQATVTFTAPSNIGGSSIISYTVISNPGELENSASSSPITVSGLSNGTAYTFRVWATNSYGPSAYSAASGSATPSAPKALYYGGFLPTSTLVQSIEYVTIATTGNATTFGNLLAATRLNAATGSTTRGLQARGLTSDQNVIEYVTYATTGNSQDFGDLTVARYALAAANSSTRSLFAGGDTGTASNVIDYVTTATLGNATDFGDLTGVVSNFCGFSSPTRSVFAGGLGAGGGNTISYVTTATTGDADDFGDLLGSIYNIAGCSSSTRGIIAGDSNYLINTIQYVTIASTGNAVDFGDTTIPGQWKAGASSETRGLILGGQNGSSTPADAVNNIEYITIASTGNALDFGDLTTAKEQGAASSGVNGGLQ